MADEQPPRNVVPTQQERRKIAAQLAKGYFAVDRIAFLYRPAIHTPHTWAPDEAEGNVITGTPIESIALDTKIPKLVMLDLNAKPITSSDEQYIIDSASALADKIHGPVAARLVSILYRIANDPPYWRNPRITVDMNELLDELSYERDARGYHTSDNRERLRDALRALCRVEIRGQQFNGRGERVVYHAPLVAIRESRYDAEETRDIPLSRILEEGLPQSLTLELGWYEGVRRRADGRLGNNYALMPSSMGHYIGADPADKLATEEKLLDFLWMRYSLTRPDSPKLPLTLHVALTRAGITNQNITRARQTLEKALDRLKDRGQIAGYTPLPKNRGDKFTITLQLPAPVPSHSANAPDDAIPPTDTEITPSPDAEPIQQATEALDSTQGEYTYHHSLDIDGRILDASPVWQLIWEWARPHFPAPVADHFRSVKPIWQVTQETDGEMSYALYLGVSSGMVRRIQSALAPIHAAVDSLYPQQFFTVDVGPYTTQKSE